MTRECRKCLYFKKDRQVKYCLLAAESFPASASVALFSSTKEEGECPCFKPKPPKMTITENDKDAFREYYYNLTTLK